MKANVRADAEPKRGTVLGTYEGKSADALVENNNQMTLGPDLWKNLFNSEEYKRDLARGMYIGFLGHPDDVGCQDFRNGCIVMREGKYLEDTGEVWARFDLIDTPVGRIVKAFQDAGVTFGISVRGAGDIDGNGQVDPDTFVFRGFDLVAFPAYDDAIPTFSEIAASHDVDKQVKYKGICSAISKNISSVTSSTAIEILQNTVGKTSKPYEVLQQRKEEIEASSQDYSPIDLSQQKLAGMTELYLGQVQANKKLEKRLQAVMEQNKILSSANIHMERQIQASKRIMAAQLKDATSMLDDVEAKHKTAVSANTRLKETLTKVRASNDKASRNYDTLNRQYQDLNLRYNKVTHTLDQIRKDNLNYQQKINSSTAEIQSKSETISKLERKLQETVLAASKVEKGTSNLGARVRELETEIETSTKLVEQYQEAYAELYASALGVHLDNIPVTASTTVAELKQKINSGTSTCNIAVNPDTMDPPDLVDEDEDDGDLILA